MMYFNILRSIMCNLLGLPVRPGFVTYLVTFRCNSRCVFCDVWKKHDRGEEDLSVPEVETVFRRLGRLDAVRITGGEPFLRSDLADVVNVIDRVSRPSVIHITSNGFLPQSIRQTVLALRSPRKVHIKISIDHLSEKHDAIRGVPGGYDKAMESVRLLVSLRGQYGFHVGVNQAIIDEKDIEAYFGLKKILDPLGVPIYPSVAFDPENGLYSGKLMADPAGSLRMFGDFSKVGLQRFMALVIDEGQRISSLAERVLNQYHLMGMYNRFVLAKNSPSPKCVALGDHLRILPNGDVPVCLYNGHIVGNLRRQSLQEIQRAAETKKQRQWVKKCPGCWQSCETCVSAIYTGDFVKGFFYNKLPRG